MTRHVRLKTPCPLCQGRLDAVVRRMPLLGWHMVGLTCGHGCDIRWFNRDIDFSRLWYPTAEDCAEYPDDFLRGCVECVDMLLSTECPKCGERPQIGEGPRMCERFPSVSCRCASEWGGDLCEAAREHNPYTTWNTCPDIGWPVWATLRETRNLTKSCLWRTSTGARIRALGTRLEREGFCLVSGRGDCAAPFVFNVFLFKGQAHPDRLLRQGARVCADFLVQQRIQDERGRFRAALL